RIRRCAAARPPPCAAPRNPTRAFLAPYRLESGPREQVMGGTNPYIQPVQAKLPTKKYTITFLPMNKVVEVDPSKLPYAREGNKGSILEIALGHGVEIDHACGGVCACSTCHVIVKKG